MKPLLKMILSLLLEASILRTTIASECSSPLGMESHDIEDSQLSASSSWGSQWLPREARLNGGSAWNPRIYSPSEWLQIDLLERTSITGIQSQGYRLGLTSYYVRSFKLLYSEDGADWNTYQENGSDKIFVGNSNADGVKTNNIDPPIVTRFIRMMAVTWNNGIAFRLELLGCELQPSTPLMTRTSTVTRLKTVSAAAMTASMATSITTSASSVVQQRSTISSGTSPFSYYSTSGKVNSEGTVGNQAGSISSTIIGGVAAAGVVIFIIGIIVSIFYVRRRRSRGNEGKQSAPQPEEMDRNNIRGPVPDDGEYVDTLPSNVNSQQTGADNGGYENIPMDASVTQQQFGTSGGVYEKIPPATPSGHYEELRPAVYQSLQKW